MFIHSEYAKKFIYVLENPIDRLHRVIQLKELSIRQKLFPTIFCSNEQLFYRECMAIIENAKASMDELSKKENKGVKCNHIVTESEVIYSAQRLHHFFKISFSNRPIEFDEHSFFLLAQMLEYQSDRYVEFFGDRNSNYQNMLDYPAIFITYYISEVIYLLHAGVFQLRRFRSVFSLEITPKYNNLRKQYLINIAFEQQSTISKRHEVEKFREKLNRGAQVDVNDSSFDELFTKVFSLSDKELEQSFTERNDYKTFKSIFIFCCIVEALGRVHSNFFYDQTNIDPKILSLIFGILRSPPNLVNKYIFLEGNLIKKGAIKLEYGMFQIAAPILHLKGPSKQDLKGNLESILGDQFEAMVKNRLYRTTGFGLKVVCENILSHDLPAHKSLDVDLIIFDDIDDHYYFAQIKYFSPESPPTYLREQLKHFERKVLQSSKKGGCSAFQQIDNFMSIIDHSDTQDMLRKKGIHRAKSSNSTGIVIHNLSFLNLIDHKGILFFEWNFFKNLIQNGKVSVYNPSKSENPFSTETFENRVVLRDINNIIDSYLFRHGMGSDMGDMWERFKDAKCHFRFGKYLYSAPSF